LIGAAADGMNRAAAEISGAMREVSDGDGDGESVVGDAVGAVVELPADAVTGWSSAVGVGVSGDCGGCRSSVGDWDCGSSAESEGGSGIDAGSADWIVGCG
jgi:hypothetical protein